jgi:hypothetical protein
MIPHLPRPARSHTAAVTRTLRRLQKGADAVDQEKVKRPKRPSYAFNALQDLTPRTVLASAAPDSD